jgi:hypothetical protein
MISEIRSPMANHTLSASEEEALELLLFEQQSSKHSGDNYLSQTGLTHKGYNKKFLFGEALKIDYVFSGTRNAIQ